MSGRGVAALQTGHKVEPSGAPFVAGSARNGLSVDATGKIVLGQLLGEAGNPAILLQEREIPMAGFDLSLTGAGQLNLNASGAANTLNSFLYINKAGVTAPALQIAQSYDGVERIIIQIDQPFNFVGVVPYQWRQVVVDNGDGTRNAVMEWGFNIGGLVLAGQNGTWYAQEPRFLSGGSILVENHLIYYNPDGNTSRLFSSTVTTAATLANSRGQWDFRSENFSWFTLDNTQFGAFTFDKVGGDAQLLLQSRAASVPRIALNDGVNVANIFNTSQSVQITNVGLTLNGRQLDGMNLVLNNTSGALSAQMNFIRSTGQGFTLSLAGAAVGGGLAGKFYMFDSKNSHVPFIVKENNSVQIANDAVAAGNNATLQLFADAGTQLGDLTTANPLSGLAKLMFGGIVAGAVVLDAANYWEVKVNGVIKKILIAT